MKSDAYYDLNAEYLYVMQNLYIDYAYICMGKHTSWEHMSNDYFDMGLMGGEI